MERETLERARMYMEKLANGVNPIDGSQIPDGDVVNNVRLSRCFFYVEGVLRQMLEGSRAPKKKKEKKAPFTFPIERRGAFAFSAQPIPVSEISKRINALIADETMAKLPASAIQDWLLSLGILEEYPNNRGKIAKRPTSHGANIGITLESRMGQSETYFVVVYNLDAQHFILDNMDAIVQHMRSNMENQGHPWQASHDACLRELYAKGASVQEMELALKRNSSAIRKRLKRLGLTE